MLGGSWEKMSFTADKTEIIVFHLREEWLNKLEFLNKQAEDKSMNNKAILKYPPRSTTTLEQRPLIHCCKVK